MPRVEIVATGVNEATVMLKGIDGRLKDPRAFLEGDLTNEAHEFFEDQFATAGAAGGEPWAPLSPEAIAYKERYGRSGMGILRFTNALWASFTKRGDPLGRELVTEDSLEIGSADPLAGLHQDGMPRLPARKIIPEVIPDEYTEKWAALALDYIEGD